MPDAPIADCALCYLRAGLCVLPADVAEKRPTLAKWKGYRTRLPTEKQVQTWFASSPAICILTGAVSGNLEMIDFDHQGMFFEPWRQLVEAERPGLIARLVIERSQSSGYHAIYRCADSVPGSRKLAQRATTVPDAEPVTIGGKRCVPRKVGDHWEVCYTLIETRGDGGLFLCDPSPGYAMQQGSLTKPPVLTADEHAVLIEAACALNEVIPRPARDPLGSMPGGRPGDDFNERGDIRQVLIRNGWTLIRGGDNEYWRRPGKDWGWSATLKDRVFYNFTGAVERLEKEVAYSPFAVYGLLEHNGDFAAAATALRAEGFGRDVDLSGLLGEVEEPEDRPTIVDPGPIPENLLHVPGFVSEVMDFCLRAARYASKPLAFCGAMALQSFLASRRVREEGGLRPNLYVLALAGSGIGKAYPRKINSYILGRIGMGAAVGNQIASGQGLEDEMLVHRKMLFQTDEIDHLLRCLSSSKESYYSMLLAMLLQLYTEADEIHTVRTKVRERGRKSEPRGEIDQPGLVIFGTATPECFFEALNPRLLTNGLFSRAIIVDAESRGRKQQARDVSELPQRLLDVASWWRDYNPGAINGVTGRRPNLDDEHPTPAVVPYSETGFATLDRFATIADDEYDAATRAGDRVHAVVWTRASENATRLALVYACSRNHLDPCIDEPAAEWAVAFVGHLIRRMIFLAAQHVAENPFHAECLKLLRKLRGAGGQLSRRELMRLCRAKAADFDQVVGTLLQQGELVQAEIPTRTKTATGYRIP